MNELIAKLDKLYLSSGSAYLPSNGVNKGAHYSGLGRGKLSINDLMSLDIKYVDYVDGIYFLFSNERGAIEEIPDCIFTIKGGEYLKVITNYSFLDTDKLIRVEDWEEVLPSVELSYKYNGLDIYPIEYNEDNYGAVYITDLDGLFWVAYQSHYKVKDRVRSFKEYDQAEEYYLELVEELIE